MQKYSRKSGITLIEILCALNIIAIFSIFLISLQLNNMKLKKYNDEKIKYVEVLQEIKEEISDNLTYEEVRTLMSQNRIYINYNKLSLDIIRNSDIKDIFSSSLLDTDKSYVAMQIADGAVLKIEAALYMKVDNTEDTILCTFYKGNYL